MQMLGEMCTKLYSSSLDVYLLKFPLIKIGDGEKPKICKKWDPVGYLNYSFTLAQPDVI